MVVTDTCRKKDREDLVYLKAKRIRQRSREDGQMEWESGVKERDRERVKMGKTSVVYR